MNEMNNVVRAQNKRKTLRKMKGFYIKQAPSHLPENTSAGFGTTFFSLLVCLSAGLLVKD
jgi:hypothetical protein